MSFNTRVNDAEKREGFDFYGNFPFLSVKFWALDDNLGYDEEFTLLLILNSIDFDKSFHATSILNRRLFVEVRAIFFYHLKGVRPKIRLK